MRLEKGTQGEFREEESEMESELLPMPRWLTVLGWIAFPGTLFAALDLVFEQTFLTWSQGDQMVGFSIFHLLGPLPFFSLIASHVFLVGVCLSVAWQHFRQKQLANVPFGLIFVLLLCVLAVYVPYGTWKRAMIALKGPGPQAAQLLVYAAHDGDRLTLEMLLSRGVAVDVRNGQSTALDGACAGHQIEIARLLLSKGAKITDAPNCQDVFPLLYKPQ
jgi:hypothetical protein